MYVPENLKNKETKVMKLLINEKYKNCKYKPISEKFFQSSHTKRIIYKIGNDKLKLECQKVIINFVKPFIFIKIFIFINNEIIEDEKLITNNIKEIIDFQIKLLKEENKSVDNIYTFYKTF